MKATLVYENSFGYVVFKKILLESCERIVVGNPGEYQFSDKWVIKFSLSTRSKKRFSKTFINFSRATALRNESFIILKGYHDIPVNQFDGNTICFSQDIFELTKGLDVLRSSLEGTK